jgi:protein TonB
MTTATQAVAERVAETAAAPVIGAPSTTPSISLPTWKSKVETLLERSKRYPGISQARQEEGVVHVSFVIDRNGHLLGSRIEKSSGFEALDGEALALLTRAQPFPSLPAEISGAHARLSVPIRFKLK